MVWGNFRRFYGLTNEPGACREKEPSRIGFGGNLAGFKALGTSRSACRDQQLPAIEFVVVSPVLWPYERTCVRVVTNSHPVIEFRGSIPRFNAVEST